jgi:hydrogenase maturation protease
MARVLILGYGNPLRGDDGVGWRAAVELFRTIATPEVEVLPCHQLTPDLAEPVSHAELVLFLDGARGSRAGEFRCEEIHAIDGSPALTHHVSPGSLLAMARDLYGAFPRAWLLTIGGRSFEARESLSPEVEAAIRTLKSRVRQLIEETIGDFVAAR